MKSLIPWAKSNPITIGSSVVVVSSIILLLVIGSRGTAFVDQLSERSQVIKQIKKLMKSSVNVPPLKPDDPEREVSIAVNQTAIDELTRVYGQMNEQYAQIRQLAVDFNQQDHRPMLDGLFPEPAVGKDHDAKRAYLQAFRNLLGPFDPDLPQPALNASSPVSRAKLAETAGMAQNNFLKTRIFPPKDSVSELDEQQLADLKRFKTDKLMDLLKRHAQSIHIYAETDLESPQFPFAVDQWSKVGDRPEINQVWWGQMGLWIQQDIVAVISAINRVNDPEANVLTSAVKRLINIEIVPGYVGINGTGGFAPRDGRSGFSAVGRDTKALAANPAGAEKRIPDNFKLSPTGRYSCPLYDVIHVWVTVDIDAERIPDFIDHLRRFNFMTVLNVKISDIDEYELLRSGYLYGRGDAVRMKALMETVWLREWTVGYMPQPVREELGVVWENAD